MKATSFQQFCDSLPSWKVDATDSSGDADLVSPLVLMPRPRGEVDPKVEQEKGGKGKKNSKRARNGEEWMKESQVRGNMERSVDGGRDGRRARKIEDVRRMGWKRRRWRSRVRVQTRRTPKVQTIEAMGSNDIHMLLRTFWNGSCVKC